MVKRLVWGVVMVAAAVSCSRSDGSFANVAYFSSSSSVSEIRVADEDNLITRELSVRLAKPQDDDVSVAFRIDGTLLERYREIYDDESATLLPSSAYELTSSEVSISEGAVESLPVQLLIKGANSLPNLKGHYVLPISLTSSDVDILGSGGTLYVMLSKASLVNVAADLTQNRAWPSWKDPSQFKDLATFTMEALVNATTFKRNDDDGNRIASPLASVMGIEDRFLIRVGDTLIPDNQIQVAWAQQDGEGATQRGSLSNAAMQLKAGVWYHIAVTFSSGEIKAYLNGAPVGSANSSDIGVTTVDFSTEHSEEDDGKPRCFWVGYSYDKYRYWNGMLSEVRLWNRALSEEEINSDKHFYRVDPASEGLIAYWKFDDGTGSTVKDYSSLGNDLTSQLPLSWYSVSLPQE